MKALKKDVTERYQNATEMVMDLRRALKEPNMDFVSNNVEYVIYKRLGDIESELNDKRFLRCHQSYLVNMNYIKNVDKHFELTNGEIVCIRQRSLKAIRQEYLDYLNSKKN